jgi:hypothetical protein
MAAATAGLLSACGAGQIAQTATKESSIQGVNVDVKEVAIRNALIDFPANDKEWPAGGSAPLSLRLVNTSENPDKLTGVSVSPDVAGYVQLAGARPGAQASVPGVTPSGSASASPSGTASPSGSSSPSAGGTPSSSSPSPTALPSGSPAETQISLDLPPAGLVALDDAGPALVLQNLRKAITPDAFVVVTFTFEKAGSVDVKLPVAPPMTPLPRVTLPDVLEHPAKAAE